MTAHRPRRALLAALVAGLALAGCAATPPAPVTPATVTAVPPLPAGVVDPATPAPTGSTATAPPCVPEASSLAPPATLPAPGAMPANSTMAAIQQNGALRVGVDQNTFDWGYRDPTTGQIVGFDIDIARAVARAIFGDDKHITFVAITSAQRIPYIQQGKVDLVADTMTINCARLTQVAFSSVYYEAGQQVLVPRLSAATDLADLAGQKVCAAAGSTSIANLARASPPVIPVAVNDWTDCLVMLQQNQVAAISTDNAILAGMVAQDPDTKIVGPAFTREPYGLAMSGDRNHQDLVRFVNGVLARMRADSEWAAIYHRWLPGPVPAPPPARYAG